MSMSMADQAALKAFFASRRGSRVLIAAVQTKLSEFCIARNTTLAELNTARPPEGHRFVQWVEEWRTLG